MPSCEVKGDHVRTNPTPTLERFAGQRYVLLTSYRKPQEAGTTLLSGILPDQSALYGVLLQLIRLGLVLLSLETSEAQGA
jgi:hypothetical protein